MLSNGNYYTTLVLSLIFLHINSSSFPYEFFITFADHSDVEQSANLSTFFDIGGIIGGILAGLISDYSGMSASTCSVMLIAAIPMVS